MKKIFENAVWWSGVVMVGLVLGISLQFVRAWTEPTDVPPGGNVGAPINTGPIEQLRQGALGIVGLLKLYGGLQVPASITSGTPQAGYVLTAKDASGQVEWKPPTTTGGTNTDGYCKMVADPSQPQIWFCSSPSPDPPAYCGSDGWCACSSGTLLQTGSSGGGQPSHVYMPSLGDWGEFTCQL